MPECGTAAMYSMATPIVGRACGALGLGGGRASTGSSIEPDPGQVPTAPSPHSARIRLGTAMRVVMARPARTWARRRALSEGGDQHAHPADRQWLAPDSGSEPGMSGTGQSTPQNNDVWFIAHPHFRPEIDSTWFGAHTAPALHLYWTVGLVGSTAPASLRGDPLPYVFWLRRVLQAGTGAGCAT